MRRICFFISAFFFLCSCDKEEIIEDVVDYKGKYDYYINIQIHDNGHPFVFRVKKQHHHDVFYSSISDKDTIANTHTFSCKAIDLFENYDGFVDWTCDDLADGKFSAELCLHGNDDLFEGYYDDYLEDAEKLTGDISGFFLPYEGYYIDEKHCQFEINITN